MPRILIKNQGNVLLKRKFSFRAKLDSQASYLLAIQSSNLCLPISMSDHNSWTLGPICLKIRLGNLLKHREYFLDLQSWILKLIFNITQGTKQFFNSYIFATWCRRSLKFHTLNYAIYIIKQNIPIYICVAYSRPNGWTDWLAGCRVL